MLRCAGYGAAVERLRGVLAIDSVTVAEARQLASHWPLTTLPPVQPLIRNSFRTLKGHLVLAAVCCDAATAKLQPALDNVYHAAVCDFPFASVALMGGVALFRALFRFALPAVTCCSNAALAALYECCAHRAVRMLRPPRCRGSI